MKNSNELWGTKYLLEYVSVDTWQESEHLSEQTYANDLTVHKVGCSGERVVGSFFYVLFPICPIG
jgi:hypothetical protein